MNRYHPRQPVKGKPHIKKGARSRRGKWVATIVFSEVRWDIETDSGAKPVTAYRALMRKLKWIRQGMPRRKA